MSRDEILLKGRLKGYQRMKLSKLLDMHYTPGELADEIGFTQRQVYRVYLKYGCPHVRDKHKHIFINGLEFRKWYEATYPRITLAEDEGFCLTCKKAIKIKNPIKKQKEYLVYLVFYCPVCGRKIPRIMKQEKRNR
jgi:hypothetical protein